MARIILYTFIKCDKIEFGSLVIMMELTDLSVLYEWVALQSCQIAISKIGSSGGAIEIIIYFQQISINIYSISQRETPKSTCRTQYHVRHNTIFFVVQKKLYTNFVQRFFAQKFNP